MKLFSRMRPKEWFDAPADIALVKAVISNNAPGVSLAIERGANPNAVGRDEITPLMFALFYPRKTKGIAALLEAGADPNQASENGPSAMGIAVQQPTDSVLRLLLDHGGNPNLGGEPLTFTAAYAERWRNMLLLLDRGADIEARDGRGSSLLMLLLSIGKWDAASEVLKRGADPRTVSGRGLTIDKLLESKAPMSGDPRNGASERFMAALAEARRGNPS